MVTRAHSFFFFLLQDVHYMLKKSTWMHTNNLQLFNYFLTHFVPFWSAGIWSRMLVMPQKPSSSRSWRFWMLWRARRVADALRFGLDEVWLNAARLPRLTQVRTSVQKERNILFPPFIPSLSLCLFLSLSLKSLLGQYWHSVLLITSIGRRPRFQHKPSSYLAFDIFFVFLSSNSNPLGVRLDLSPQSGCLSSLNPVPNPLFLCEGLKGKICGEIKDSGLETLSVSFVLYNLWIFSSFSRLFSHCSTLSMSSVHIYPCSIYACELRQLNRFAVFIFEPLEERGGVVIMQLTTHALFSHSQIIDLVYIYI